jgi:1,4-alpha-glucan branching enzyme
MGKETNMAVSSNQQDSEVTFVLKGYPDARQVYLAGDFNQWNIARHRMARARDGTFRVKVALRPGEYQYKFIADGAWITDAEAQRQVANPFGGVNSVVRIGG